MYNEMTAFVSPSLPYWPGRLVPAPSYYLGEALVRKYTMRAKEQLGTEEEGFEPH